MRPFHALVGSAALGILLGASPLAAQGWYFAAALGADWSNDATFQDVDCGSTSPPALFGCGAGFGGAQPLGAYGEFGATTTLEAGLGYGFSPVRIEARITYRPYLSFLGNANFLDASRRQPVHGEVNSVAAALAAAVDLPSFRLGEHRIRPFVGGSAGVARNDVMHVVYRFPALGANARTEVPGGTQYGFTWSGTGGLTFEISDRIQIDAAYRYNDLGEVRTEAGKATVVRNSGTTVIDVDATRADLVTNTVAVALRVGL